MTDTAIIEARIAWIIPQVLFNFTDTMFDVIDAVDILIASCHVFKHKGTGYKSIDCWG